MEEWESETKKKRTRAVLTRHYRLYAARAVACVCSIWNTDVTEDQWSLAPQSVLRWMHNGDFHFLSLPALSLPFRPPPPKKKAPKPTVVERSVSKETLNGFFTHPIRARPATAAWSRDHSTSLCIKRTVLCARLIKTSSKQKCIVCTWLNYTSCHVPVLLKDL